ncbi:hypothetical protein Tco_1346893 [Tanacetum coccineum]
MSMDDLYNNLKVYEPEVKGTSSLSTNTQNIAFVSSNSTNSTNGANNTAYGATTSTKHPQLDNRTAKQLIKMKLKERWTWGNGYANNEGKDILEEDWKKAYYEWAPRNQENRNKESTRRSVSVEITTSNDLISCDGLGDYDWSDQAED